MRNIVFSDAEIRMIGESRWSAKNNKRVFGILGAGVLLTAGAMKLASNYPKTPLGFILALIVVGGIVVVYIRYVSKPARMAGEKFLKEYYQQLSRIEVNEN